ncbi:MAG: hypothetical protein HKP58_08180 [Desulfatitalea sp.]|nr:hypothetical protein [Desulfatitalea sp.]NNK00378.1 hypothetical protein [Desulfatitalea sp.]
MKWDPIFDLNRDMLDILANEFDPSVLVDDFASKTAGKQPTEIEALSKDVFGKYGNLLMERLLDLGDRKEYMDRAYELLKEYADRPDTGPFPYVIQRFIEVAYLAINPKLYEVGILECNVRNMEFWIDKNDCNIFAAMTEKLSEDVLNLLPCRHACACLQNKLLQAKGVNDAAALQPMNMIDDDLCKFSLFREHIILPTVPRMSWDETTSDASRAGAQHVLDSDEKEILLDIRNLIPKKIIYETGGHYDRLKYGQVLKVLSSGDLQWLEKRLRMLRPGQFRCVLEKDEKQGCHTAIIERV